MLDILTASRPVLHGGDGGGVQNELLFCRVVRSSGLKSPYEGSYDTQTKNLKLPWNEGICLKFKTE